MTVTEYKLKYPIQHGSSTYEKFTIRRPTLADLREFDTSKSAILGQQEKLIQAITGELPPVIAKLDLVDAVELASIASNFFQNTPETGQNG